MFDLERFERGVVVFLACMLLSTIAVGYFRSSKPPGMPVIKRENFSMREAKRMVDINEASCEELATLKGVGKVMSERIAAYRNSNGPFGSIEEIKNVKGVGDKLFEKIKDDITVR